MTVPTPSPRPAALVNTCRYCGCTDPLDLASTDLVLIPRAELEEAASSAHLLVNLHGGAGKRAFQDLEDRLRQRSRG